MRHETRVWSLPIAIALILAVVYFATDGHEPRPPTRHVWEIQTVDPAVLAQRLDPQRRAAVLRNAPATLLLGLALPGPLGSLAVAAHADPTPMLPRRAVLGAHAGMTRKIGPESSPVVWSGSNSTPAPR